MHTDAHLLPALCLLSLRPSTHTHTHAHTQQRTLKRLERNPTKKGYVRLHTNLGDLNIELHCDIVPRCVSCGVECVCHCMR